MPKRLALPIWYKDRSRTAHVGSVQEGKKVEYGEHLGVKRVPHAMYPPTGTK